MSDEQLGAVLVNLSKINQTMTNGSFLKELNGDVLSYTAVKVAAMKATLIEFKVVAHQDLLDKEVELGRSKAQAYLRFKQEHGATAAQDLKNMDEDYIEAQRVYNASKVQYEQLKSVTADAHDLIDAIKSRVIDLQAARRDERVG